MATQQQGGKVTDSFKEIMLGRRSVRYYDPEVKISREELSAILEDASRAPSSINAQPWRFLVIDSPEGKETLAPLAPTNKSQVETSSAVIAVFGDLNHFDNAEEIYSKAVELGYMAKEVKEEKLAKYSAGYKVIPQSVLKDIVLVDGGLVSMAIMLMARAHGYDTCPIGGYAKDKIAEAFGMEKDRYVPVMLISIGKMAKEPHNSYRLPIDRVTTFK